MWPTRLPYDPQPIDSYFFTHILYPNYYFLITLLKELYENTYAIVLICCNRPSALLVVKVAVLAREQKHAARTISKIFL